jgi:hypothetical protein
MIIVAFRLCIAQTWWPLMQIMSSPQLLICTQANQNLNKHASIFSPPYLQSTTKMERLTSKSTTMLKSTTIMPRFKIINIPNFFAHVMQT